MSRTKGTPAKRTGGEKKSQGATPKKAKVTKVAPQTKAAIKKVVDKGIHNMRYAPIEEVVTGRTELPENYGGNAQPEPKRKSKKPNPLKQTTAERIEKENLDRRDAYEKKVRARADADRFQAQVDSEEVRKGSEKKVDKAKARSGKKIRKMSAQGKFSEKLKMYKEVKGAKKMSAPATPKKVVKPYVKKVEPVRTASGKRWFDITPTSDQTDVGKKPEAKVRSLHKNARIKGLVDLRERTAADMAKGEAQRLTAAERKVAEQKKAQELIDARKSKKPTEIKKKGKKMAGRPKKTKASVDAKLAKADEIYKEELAKSPDEAKKANTEKKSTKAKTTKVVVEETKPKATKKRGPRKTKIIKPEVQNRANVLDEAKAKAPTPKPVSEAKAATVADAGKKPGKISTAAKKATGKVTTAIGKTDTGKVIAQAAKTQVGQTVIKSAKKKVSNTTKVIKVAGKVADKALKYGTLARAGAQVVSGQSEKDFRRIQELENKIAKMKGQKPKYTTVGSNKNLVSSIKTDIGTGVNYATFGLLGKNAKDRIAELKKMAGDTPKSGTKPGTKSSTKPGTPGAPGAKPSTSTGNKYRVEHNDTLSGIAKKAGVTLAELRAANPQLANKGIFRNTGVNIPKGKKVPAGGYSGPVPYKGK